MFETSLLTLTVAALLLIAFLANAALVIYAKLRFHGVTPEVFQLWVFKKPRELILCMFCETLALLVGLAAFAVHVLLMDPLDEVVVLPAAIVCASLSLAGMRYALKIIPPKRATSGALGR